MPRALVTAEPHSRIPELDGIRGIAILMVLMVHFGSAPGLPSAVGAVVEFGWAGVDLFFVLSGFLITGILLSTRQHEGYFSTFYRNRTLRIFPIYYAFLLVALVLAPEWKQVAYWLYLGHFMNASDQPIKYMRHFWSLAIEEQFYLL